MDMMINYLLQKNSNQEITGVYDGFVFDNQGEKVQPFSIYDSLTDPDNPNSLSTYAKTFMLMLDVMAEYHDMTGKGKEDITRLSQTYMRNLEQRNIIPDYIDFGNSLPSTKVDRINNLPLTMYFWIMTEHPNIFSHKDIAQVIPHVLKIADLSESEGIIGNASLSNQTQLSKTIVAAHYFLKGFYNIANREN